ncbi:recombinase family protein [Pseudomonas ficuserectae]|uniref:recombinase family protein n=1 Tax=Pseudomonas ficuserectae TaxID=53410 RepID=UPI0006D617AF|nr:recombinase family protein [Pseudomonas ficuserectae]KPX35940.1 hypothetical protein ALO69_200122 [Pseudomonas ficuserectae]RMS29254.1 hypothetical protein ALP68_200077 [Pseudomonas ficuserectae]
MIIRAYLRASTKQQDANRARQQLTSFAADHGVRITTFYVENESGTRTDRPELDRLIAESHKGEILLCEAVDRLSRHDQEEWLRLRGKIDNAGLRIVSTDMPLTWAALADHSHADPMIQWMQSSMSTMMLDVMAAFARRDYERRRHVQGQGIEKAKAAGKYKGRAVDPVLHERIRSLVGNLSIRKVASILNCSPSTVFNVKRTMEVTAKSDSGR